MSRNLFKHRTSNDFVEVWKREDGNVHFARQGGGFSMVLPEARFDEEFAVFTDKVPFRKGTVTADFLPDGLSLPCYSDGMRWNGWGMPWFDKAAVDKLIEVSEAADNGMPYLKWEGEILRQYDYNEGEYYDITPAELDVNGEKVVAWRGGDGWTWDRVEFDQPKT